MRALSDYLGYALNNLFISNSLAKIFDEEGTIKVEEFDLLSNSIKSKSSMFELAAEKINEFAHLNELSQLLATFIKIKMNSGTPELDQTIELIKSGLTDYTFEKYKAIKENEFCMRFQNNSSGLKSREVYETLSSDLFPKDNYKLQNIRLTLLLGATAPSPLKTEVQKFQQKIQDSHFKLKFVAGLNKSSLAKDLNILGDLLINPSTETFQKYATRIERSEKASNKREIGGHVITSGTILTLGGLAGVLMLGGPALPLGLATAGLFATGSSGAVLGFKTARERKHYRSELEQIESQFSNKNIKEWLFSQLNPLVKNEKLDIHKLKTLYEQIKTNKNIYCLSNSLADLIFTQKNLDMETSDLLKKIREQLAKSLPVNIEIQAEESQSFVDSINKNVDWAESECKKLKENINFSIESGSNEIQVDYAGFLNTLEFVEKFNQQIKIALDDMIKRGTKNEARDTILHNFLKEIKQITNEDKLIYNLDNAIFALVTNSKGSKIGQDFQNLRESLMSKKEELESVIKFSQ